MTNQDPANDPSSLGSDARLASAPQQFVRPQGAVGALTGWILRLFNAGLNRRAVELLPLTPEAQVLEIGFGPGHALTLIARRVPQGKICGVDPSPVMMRQARRRNREALRTGRMDLQEGTADRLPWPEGSFHAVLSLNNVLFWRPLETSLLEIRRVLLPQGVCLIGLHGAAARVFTRAGSHAFQEVDRYLLPAFQRAGLPLLQRSEVRTATGRGVLYLLRRPATTPAP
jgi:SAM-dependent methyltransferase